MLSETSGRNIFLIVFIATLTIGGLMIFLVFNVVYPSVNSSLQTTPIATNTAILSPTKEISTSTASPTLTQNPVPTTTPTSIATNYTVQAGDTLGAIAQRFSTTVDTLKTLNNLQGDIIHPGQILVIALLPGDVLPTQTLTVTNSPPPIPENGEHIVTSGETLSDIASHYGVSIQDIRLANFMIGDTILPGQRLKIPIAESPTQSPWRFSIIEGNLAAAYPHVLEKDRFTLHYSPGTYPAQDPEILADLVHRALANIENVMAATLPDHFDVYVAGSVFAAPNRTLRGRTFSYRWETFFLHDGTGNPSDQLYIATHELTHLFAWNVFGQPVSVMLSEGAAVYAGMKAIESSHHIPVNKFCHAYLQAGKLPYISTTLSYQGHNLDLENYYSAGCFVGYLIETYGPSSFARLYSTEDYSGIYGKSLSELESDWRVQLSSQNDLGNINPNELSDLVEQVTNSYASFFSNFTGTNLQIAAYRELDKARIALLEGEFEAAHNSLSSFREFVGGG